MKKLYMDYAASAEPNSSSIHEFGMLAKKKLEYARAEVAGILSARKTEVIFTSGGTEGNNLAIQGVIFANQGKKDLPHIVTTNIEHPSVLETCKLLEKRKLAELTIVAVEVNGIVDPRKIKKAIKPHTVLVSVIYANNEIGTIQPIREIAKEIRHYKKTNNADIVFHTDAVQAVNYLDLNVEKLGVDLLTLSGSKIKGAGRVGVLYKRSGVNIENIFGGGDQEGGLRGGTENLADILKFASALKKINSTKEKESKRLIGLRDYFFKKLEKLGFIANGDKENRLPNNVNVTFPKIPSDLLVIELSAHGVMTSSKSACKSSSSGGSYVIKALRPEADPEIGGVRFSLGNDTKKENIDYTLKALTRILLKLKKWYN
jgi:cysteine desulfurase